MNKLDLQIKSIALEDMGNIRKDFTYKNVRFLQVKQNYLVVYNLENETINILRVLSNYQKNCNLL